MSKYARSEATQNATTKTAAPKSLASGKKIGKGAGTKAKAATKGKPAAKAVKAKGTTNGAAKQNKYDIPLGRLSDDATIKVTGANPHRDTSSKASQCFVIASKAGTVGKYRAAVEKAGCAQINYLGYLVGRKLATVK